MRTVNITLFAIFLLFCCKNIYGQNATLPANSDCDVIDVGLIIDASSTVGEENFETIRRFLVSLVSRLSVGLNTTRVFGLSFNSAPHVHWALRDSQNNALVLEKINEIVYRPTPGSKRAGKALARAANIQFTQSQGDRQGAPDLALVLTDGNSTDDPGQRSRVLKRKGIRVVVVAVGEDIDYEEIHEIATKPISNNVFNISNIDEVVDIVREISLSCPSVANMFEEFPLPVSTSLTPPTEPAITVRDRSTPGGVSNVRRCYSGPLTSGSGYLINRVDEVVCPPESTCAETTIVVSWKVGDVAVESRIHILQCRPRIQCERFNCVRLQISTLHAFPANSSVDECYSRCCDSDLCNAPRIEGSESERVRCAAEVTSNVQDEIPSGICDAGLICAQFTVPMSSSETNTTSSYLCLPPDACNRFTCDVLASTMPNSPLRFNGSDCMTRCCNQSMCYDPSSVNPISPPTMPHTSEFPGLPQITTPETTTFIRTDMFATTGITPRTLVCYTGVKIQAESFNRDEQSVRVCAEGLICSDITANVTINFGLGNLSAEVSVGQCMPSSVCGALTCEQVEQFLPPNIAPQFGDCRVACCAENLCNSPRTVFPQVTTTAPVPPFTIDQSNATDGGQLGNRCYSGMRLTGSEINQNQLVERQCGPSQSCAGFSVRGTISFGATSFEVEGTVGGCVQSFACTSLSCDRLLSLVRLPPGTNFNFDDCNASCCIGDLCNDFHLPPIASATTQPNVIFPPLTELWRRVTLIEDEINQIIPSFYPYVYDDTIPPINHIRDGNNDMYDTGNQIKFYQGNFEPRSYLQYRTDITFPDYSLTIGGEGHPFMTLARIANTHNNFDTFTLQVEGNLGADGSGTIARDSGSLQVSNANVDYNFFQVFGAGDPSVCEVYFTISDEDWGSDVQNSRFSILRFSRETNSVSNSVRLEGGPRDVVMGYALLSKRAGARVSSQEIEQFLRRLAQLITDSPQPTSPTSLCGFTDNALSFNRNIFSPDWPSSYPNNRDCEWTITSSFRNRIQFEFVSFRTEHCCDYLTFNENGNETLRLRGTHPSRSPYTSSTNRVILRFHSDSSVTDVGFHIRYREVVERTTTTTTTQTTTIRPGSCGFTAIARPVSQPLTSPGWPSQYRNNLRCTWILSARPGDRIQIDFTTFNTESCCDRLTIDGTNYAGSPLTPFTFTSARWQVVLNFRSDGSVSGRGFQATFRAIGGLPQNRTTARPTTPSTPAVTTPRPTTSPAMPMTRVITARPITSTSQLCGGITGTNTFRSGILASPNWPRNYYNNLRCNWAIVANRGYQMQLTIISFRTESCCDYLSIRDGDRQIARLLGSPTNVGPYTSTSGRFDLYFYTDSSVTDRGFEIATMEIRQRTTTAQTTREVTTYGEQSTTPEPTTIIATTDVATSRPTSSPDAIVEEALDELNASSNKITSSISNWYSYRYDGSRSLNPNLIRDGGSDMYDGGNGIYVYKNGNETISAEYNQSYRFEDYEFATNMDHPFFALLWVKNPENLRVNFTIRVSGNAGADGGGRITINTGDLTEGEHSIQYQVFQISGAGDPSICEVYFIVSSETWQSAGEEGFSRLRFGTSTDVLDNAVQLVGTPRNVMMGYTLLSKRSGFAIPPSEITNAMRTIVTSLSNVSPMRPSEVGDLEFLPSCSVRHAVNSIFRCDHVFANVNFYRGSMTCRNEIDQVIRCIGNQLIQCRVGGGINKLDSFNLPNFNSKSMISFLHNLTLQPGKIPNNEINTFCFHAGQDLSYPHPVETSLGLCEQGVLDDLLERAKSFYYAYAWARSRAEICRAYQELKQWFLDTANSDRCNFDRIFEQGNPRQTSRYLRRLIQVVLDEAERMDSTACSDNQDDLDVFVLQTFTCPDKRIQGGP